MTHPLVPAGSVGEPAPHASEEIHVVPPSWQPLVLALGLTLTLAGTAVTPLLWMAGMVVSMSAIVNWLTALRRDVHPVGRDDGAAPAS